MWLQPTARLHLASIRTDGQRARLDPGMPRECLDPPRVNAIIAFMTGISDRRVGRRAFTTGVVAAGAAVTLAPRSALAASWKTITRKQGILVSTRDEEGRQFPTFRGIGRVSANMWFILAVLEDANKHTQWMHDCSGSKVVEKVDDTSQIVYNRTDAPWPVADRDVVLKTKFSLTDDGKEIWARFKHTRSSKMGAVGGVIRMPYLKGHYHLVSIDEGHSLVEYRVNADPGGTLPDWLVKQTTKDLPLYTLINLRKQVSKMSGKYDDRMAAFKKATAAG